MNFLSPDSRFMQGWSNCVDAIIINMLMVLTSLPIITIGASLAAGQETTRRMLNAEGHWVRRYFKSFKQNFIKSTMLWVVFGLMGALVAYLWLIRIPELMVPKIAFTIVWLIGFEWVWALQARFENTVSRTLINSYVFGVSYIVATLAMIAVDLAYVALIIVSYLYVPQGLFLLAVIGYGSLLSIHVPIQEYIFRKHGYLKK
ncbi:beta-carotene 15,15'-monooxygenase [Bifidobacterium dolichotidis]|uniref:Beta-carotene 15,15'-monooxygenase n=1 Tax=Bifidobacterium dolichotidis TaxID=2306976 RepID=A0A430FKN6_9BIFI|nr:YesL family protein [Bifidobacterium dolichotidis]RSX53397.1 beta-carotene 15,15'-monooxygenase [Bifidobacterium dolichotidis]